MPPRLRLPERTPEAACSTMNLEWTRGSGWWWGMVATASPQRASAYVRPHSEADEVDDSRSRPIGRYLPSTISLNERLLWMAPVLQVKFDGQAYWSGAVFCPAY